MSDTSKCSMNFIYYFYCLLPLINQNINQIDKLEKKKCMRGNLFIHSNTPALSIYLMVLLTTSYYSTNCIKDKLQKKKSSCSLSAPQLKIIYGFQKSEGLFSKHKNY